MPRSSDKESFIDGNWADECEKEYLFKRKSNVNTIEESEIPDSISNATVTSGTSYAAILRGKSSKTEQKKTEPCTTSNEDLSLTSHFDICHVDSPVKNAFNDLRSDAGLLDDEDTVMFNLNHQSSSSSKGFNSKRPFEMIASSVSASKTIHSNMKSTQSEPKKIKSELNSDVHSNDVCTPTKSNKFKNEKLLSPSSQLSLTHSSENMDDSKRELENDPEILQRRQKQIDYGKNTIGYETYLKNVPKHERTTGQPKTPPKHLQMSRRAWDGLIKNWKLKLHKWDPVTEDEEFDVHSADLDLCLYASDDPTVPSNYESSSIYSDQSTPSSPGKSSSRSRNESECVEEGIEKNSSTSKNGLLSDDRNQKNRSPKT